MEWLINGLRVLINAVIITYGKTENGDEIIAATTIVLEEVEKAISKKKSKRMSQAYNEDYHLNNKPESIIELYNRH